MMFAAALGKSILPHLGASKTVTLHVAGTAIGVETARGQPSEILPRALQGAPSRWAETGGAPSFGEGEGAPCLRRAAARLPRRPTAP